MATGDWIGVDLGTTTIRVASHHGMSHAIPAVVGLNGQTRLIGEAAQERAVLRPQNAIADGLRMLGRRFTESATVALAQQLPYQICEAHNGDAWIRADDVDYPPPQIMAMLLSAVIDQTMDTEGAVIVIPASFDAARRQAVLDAARIAGVTCRRLLPAPMAIALARYQERQVDERVAIVDLGGGHLDIAIVDIASTAIVVRGLDGDDMLGGRDLDALVCARVIEAHALNADDPSVRQRLREAVERARCTLSAQDSASIALPFLSTTSGASLNLSVTLTRTDFEKMVREKLELLSSIARRGLHRSGVDAADLDAVLLVGGVAPTHAVQEALRGVFGQIPQVPEQAESAAVTGAALLAAHLQTGALDLPTLHALNPRALMAEDADGDEHPLLLRGAMLPCKHTRTFSPTTLTLFQADRALCAVEIESSLKVTFELDQSGCLQIRARDPVSREPQPIYPTPVGGLSSFEIDALAHDAALYLQEADQRADIDKERVALDGLIYNTARNLEEFSELLNRREVRRLERAIQAGEDALDADDAEQIQSAYSALVALAKRIEDALPDLDDDFETL